MKRKTLIVVSLALFGCAFTAAQTFGFGTAVGGSGLYCNYERLSYYGGGLWAGTDTLSACGFSVNAAIVGFTSVVPNDGESAHGAGVVYGDSLYSTLYGTTDALWTVFTKLKCNKMKDGVFVGTNGWVGVAEFEGFVGGTNAGPLSCAIPGKNGVVPSAGISTGAVRPKGRKK